MRTLQRPPKWNLTLKQVTKGQSKQQKEFKVLGGVINGATVLYDMKTSPDPLAAAGTDLVNAGASEAVGEIVTALTIETGPFAFIGAAAAIGTAIQLKLLLLRIKPQSRR